MAIVFLELYLIILKGRKLIIKLIEIIYIISQKLIIII